VVAGADCCAVELDELPLPPQTKTPRMTSAITITAPIHMPDPKRRGGGSKSGDVLDVSYRVIASYFSARAVVTMCGCPPFASE
jgi:hypothetical protein